MMIPLLNYIGFDICSTTVSIRLWYCKPCNTNYSPSNYSWFLINKLNFYKLLSVFNNFFTAIRKNEEKHFKICFLFSNAQISKYLVITVNSSCKTAVMHSFLLFVYYTKRQHSTQNRHNIVKQYAYSTLGRLRLYEQHNYTTP